MVNPLRTPTISVNNQIPNTLTHTEQSQQIAFQTKQFLVAAGGVIERSSNTTSAGAADNLTTAADFVWGLAGAGWWYVIRFDNLGGGTVRFLFNANDNAGALQAIQHRGGNATWVGGTTAALPTVNTGFAYATTSVPTYHPFSDVRNLRWMSYRTANASGAQSIRFFLKEEGIAAWRHALILEGNTDASGGGIGSERWAIYLNSLIATDVLSRAQLSITTAWNGVTPAGSSTQAPTAACALWELSSSWTSGINAGGRQNNQPLILGQNPGSTAGRLLGSWVDVYGIPQNSVHAEWSDDTETGQTYRRRNFGSVAVFYPSNVATIE